VTTEQTPLPTPSGPAAAPLVPAQRTAPGDPAPTATTTNQVTTDGRHPGLLGAGIGIAAAVLVAAGIVWAITPLDGPAAAPAAGATHLAFGQAYRPRAGVTITVSAPVGDGNGHVTAYVTETNDGHHAYMIGNQYFAMGGETKAEPGIPFAILYPHRGATYPLAFAAPAPGPIVFHPDAGNAHAVPVTWGG
jgi:hypothetical protein